MIIEGLRIMAVGMGVVFVILIFLVLAVPVSARIIRIFEARQKPATSNSSADVGETNEPPITAVISAAVKAFRRK